MTSRRAIAASELAAKIPRKLPGQHDLRLRWQTAIAIEEAHRRAMATEDPLRHWKRFWRIACTRVSKLPQEFLSLMVAHSSQRVHDAIRRIFDEACHSETPLSVVGHRCADLRGHPEWSGHEVDKVGDAVLRLLSLHLRSAERDSAPKPRR